jgi:hypothetical protein
MVAEPGPNFRWGVVLRKSKLKRTVNQYGQVELVAESMDHQELEVVSHIRDNNMGVIVETDRDVASGWSPTAKYCRMEVRAWLGAGWWALILPGGGVVEVQPAGAVQGFFRGAGVQAGWQDGVLVAVAAGQVDGKAPPAGRPAVA